MTARALPDRLDAVAALETDDPPFVYASSDLLTEAAAEIRSLRVALTALVDGLAPNTDYPVDETGEVRAWLYIEALHAARAALVRSAQNDTDGGTHDG
jgi:hypothetical protein